MKWYFRIVFITLLLALTGGFLLPYLFSAKHTELVVAGFVVLFLLPVIIYIPAKKWWAELKPRLEKERADA